MGNKTILIVDDTIVNLDILVGILSEYDVIDTTSGKDALAILEEENVDLILLDIMMPDMDGFEVCKKLKENHKTQNIPVIFITAMTDEDSIEKAYEMGGVDYITKPFKPKELLARVQTQFRLKELQNKELRYLKQIALTEQIKNIAHQWRQPLSAISTMASSMLMQKEMDTLCDEMVVEYCEKITETAQYLSSIIDSFSDDLFKNVTLSHFNLKTVLEESLSFYLENQEDIQFIINIENNLEIYSSKIHLLKSVESLLENAKDAFLENIHKKAIFLNAYQKNKAIVIEIYDTAGGIKEESLNRLFEPYFTTKHQSQGKGLGLYIVQNNVEYILQGSIDVKNFKFDYQKEKYQGLKFTISLPIDLK